MAQTHDYTTQSICPACNFGPFTRNNYFTGKLLVERDFTDEARFHMEKLRHHEQQLHGWGVVCGLKVKPHDNQACRDRFISIEPGTAVDCCGYDIIVREEECVDITHLPAIKALQAKNDTEPHRLQICVRFRECPTEEIPVLYDDCGCDDTKCAPNRILESYEIDVMVDPKDEPASFYTPKLTWENSVAIAHAAHVALHATSHRLYVATADDPATVYQISTDNHATITSRTLPAKIVAQAVSNDGKHLYVVVAPTAPATFQQLHVLDTTQPGMPDFNTNPIDLSSTNSAIELAVMPDGRLLALVASSGNVRRWGSDLDTNPSPASMTIVANVGTNAQGLVLSSDGTRAFSLGSNNQIQQIDALDTATPTVTTLAVLPDTAQPSAMALVSSTAPDMLAVVDQSNLVLHLVALSPGPLLVGSVKLDHAHHAPIALVASPGGHWAYVLERDTVGRSFVQSVSLDALKQHLSVPAGKAFKVGNDSRQIVVSASGTHLYIPYVEDLSKPALGGVAVLEVSEQACADILWRHLDGCPHCDIPNCVVLATIKNYHVGDKIEAQTDPPADPAADLAGHIARIDNRRGRHLLPSTQVLTELVQCLLERGTGTNGAPGTNGEGLEKGLTRIKALSWVHNTDNNPLLGIVRLNGDTTPGIVIGFTGNVKFSTVDVAGKVVRLIDPEHIFQVLAALDDNRNESGLLCRCPIRGTVVPVDYTEDSPGHIKTATESSVDNAPGVAFLFDPENSDIIRKIRRDDIRDFWVVLRGDFVKDTQDRAVDAEFVRAELPTGDRPRPRALQPLADQLGVQGGLFESWFRTKPLPVG